MKDATSRIYLATACTGKAAFSTPQLASKVQRRRGKKRDAGKRANCAYRCQDCGFFHLGRKPKSLHAPPRAHHGDDADMI